MKIKTVTIIGSNGALGTGVGAIFASFGNAKVYMIARTKEKAEYAIKKAGLSVRANSICKNMIPKTYEKLENCVKDSDFIIETVVEDYKIKKTIHEEINRYMKNNSISSSITSGISINKLSESYNDNNRRKFFGVHFFNPPYNLQLCELITSKYSDSKTERDLEGYLKNVLHRKVVRVKDKAGFLANRIGFQFINRAMQYAQECSGLGGIDYIDEILGEFTGRNMPPLYTADFVGLDVHKAIVDNIFENTDDCFNTSFKMPEYANELIKQGNLGMKDNKGLYSNNGKLVYDIEKNEYREKREYTLKFTNSIIEHLKIGNYKEAIKVLLEEESKEAEICRKMLINYIIYSYITTKEVGYNLLDCDLAMAEGFNWVPPFALLNLIGKEEFLEKAVEYFPNCKKDICELVQKDIKSKYGYEKFMKAKR